MLVRWTRPTIGDLEARRRAAEGSSLTYAPIGISGDDTAPVGFRRDRWERTLGNGRPTFEAAADALRRWEVHRRAGLLVAADGPVHDGLVVAMNARLPIGSVDLCCRVVDVIDEPDRVGFAYGTLAEHPECGEERFTVEIGRTGTVRFVIVAVSRPAHALARVAPPVARHLQRRATTAYLDAMTELAQPAGDRR